jgi:peptide/nickel transport system permease protein
MARYVLRRLLVLCVLLVVVSFLVFSLLHIAPGSVVDTLLGSNPRTPETVQALRAQYHLDEPFLEQSMQTSLPVSEELKARLPLSLSLAAYAYLLTLAIGVPLGMAAALKRHTDLDRSIVAATVIGLSTPAFVSGVLLLYVFAVKLQWFPTSGRGSGLADEIRHLTLPAFALALTCVAVVVKYTRAALLSVVEQDYVTGARARGLPYPRILATYALRNAMIPLITVSAPLVAYLITGAVMVEITFSLPGIGQALVQAATLKDLPMLQAIALLVAAVTIMANLAADLLYAAVDPRIRLGRSGA